MKTVWWIPLIGLLLCTGFFLTRETGISPRDARIYEQALAAEPSVDTGFPGFRLSDVPVRIFDGEADFVRRDGAFVREKPALRVLAATALEHEGEIALIVPSMELAEGLFSLLSGESVYTDTRHAAVLWHEAFHVWQMRNRPALFALPGAGADRSVFSEGDADSSARELYGRALRALQEAADAEEDSEARSRARAFLRLSAERDARLTPEARAAERFTETLEGTARYVEIRAAEALGDDLSFYKEPTDLYTDGDAKFYNSGMLIWKILRRLDPDGAEPYDFSLPIRDRLEELLEEPK